MDTQELIRSPQQERDEPPARHQLVQLFWILGPAFSRWAETHMRQEGLTSQRLRLLGLLKEKGPMMMANLRDELGVTATNITALVDALEADGMVFRKPHPSDRRAIMVDITPETARMLTENCTEFKERVSELFSVFAAAEQEQLLSFLHRMRQALITRNILKEYDLCSKGGASHCTYEQDTRKL